MKLNVLKVHNHTRNVLSSQFFLDATKIQLFKGCTISKDENLLSAFFLGADKEPGTVSDKTSKFI